ncbi:hypothetical protein MtrunA17_Chr2g0279531 [Medicago truncatula]|uniref:Uncharacterized protein n=1 Tax=Medicago truncatula TaxID=3880 RepID=A0A396J951_MEDTR|nr:hypothetical protein MtrunA17_Chr2g0279531 [Medicago truncatula]
MSLSLAARNLLQASTTEQALTNFPGFPPLPSFSFPPLPKPDCPPFPNIPSIPKFSTIFPFLTPPPSTTSP